MLVLTRKPGQKIVIGDSIVVTVVQVQGDRIRIGFEAPPEVTILRAEVHQRRRESGIDPAAPVVRTPAIAAPALSPVPAAD